MATALTGFALIAKQNATPPKPVVAPKSSSVPASGTGNNWTNPDGSTRWPANNCFEGKPSTTTLQPGARFDRYGNPSGTFVSPEGTLYGARSLAPGSANAPYNSYEVIKPFDVQSGTVAPWFDQPGGGIQYQLPMSVQSLLDQGFIK